MSISGAFGSAEEANSVSDVNIGGSSERSIKDV